MPLCAAQPDLTMFPEFPHLRVLCRLLTTEPSVTLLVDDLWLCFVCLCLLGFSTCLPLLMQSAYWGHGHKTVETPRLIYSCPIISSYELLQGLKIVITNKWTQMDNDHKHRLQSSMIDYVRRSKLKDLSCLHPLTYKQLISLTWKNFVRIKE